MNRYHITHDGKTVDQYGRDFSAAPLKRDRPLSPWRKPRTAAVVLAAVPLKIKSK